MEPTLVFPLSLRVEHLACITAQTATNREADRQSLFRSDDYVRRDRTCAGTAQQIECMEFLTGVLQQPLNIAEPFYVLYRESGGRQANRPIVAGSRERADSGLRCWFG